MTLQQPIRLSEKFNKTVHQSAKAGSQLTDNLPKQNLTGKQLSDKATDEQGRLVEGLHKFANPLYRLADEPRTKSNSVAQSSQFNPIRFANLVKGSKGLFLVCLWSNVPN